MWVFATESATLRDEWIEVLRSSIVFHNPAMLPRLEQAIAADAAAKAAALLRPRIDSVLAVDLLNPAPEAVPSPKPASTVVTVPPVAISLRVAGIKSGVLFKQGGTWKTWKERWCVLVDKEIRYYAMKQVRRRDAVLIAYDRGL